MAGNTLSDRRILVVEDEYLIADDMRRILEGEGAVVIGPIPRVTEALRVIADADRLDAAVLDVNLGGDLVYPVAEALASRSVPYLFATGYDQAAIPDRYAASARVEKPVSKRHLSAVVSSLLEQAG